MHHEASTSGGGVHIMSALRGEQGRYVWTEQRRV